MRKCPHSAKPAYPVLHFRPLDPAPSKSNPRDIPLLLPVQTGYFSQLFWCIISLWREDQGFRWEGHLWLWQGADSVASISTGHMLGLAREGRATLKALRPQGTGPWNKGIKWHIRTHLSNTEDGSHGETEAQKDMRNV